MKPIVKRIFLILALASGPLQAGQAPQDVPRDHWAYEAVEELAGKGLILGYPDGNFLGGRSLTRYEMAALTQRLLRQLETRIDAAVKTAVDEATPSTPPAPPTKDAEPTTPGVTAGEIETVRRLVEEFKVELSVMGTDLQKVKDQIAELQGLGERVDGIEATLEGMSEQSKLMEQDLSGLKKIRISGYVQSRYESGGGIYRTGQKPADKFFVRRGRVKTQYNTPTTDFVLQIDAAQQNAVELKDAYVTWKLGLPASDREQTAFWFGQFNTPFGYEIERSSSEREFPERSMAERALFPGERDRGIRFLYGISPKLTLDAAVLNGGAANESFRDDRFKDVTLRLRSSVTPWWDLGVSGYRGKKAVAAVAAVPGSLKYTDANGDGIVDPGEITFGGAKAAVPGFEADRNRYGVDTQLFALGGSIRAESYWAKQPTADPANPDVDAFGWYAQYVYSLSSKNQLGFRYDTWDPNTDLDGDKSTRWNVAWNHFIGNNLRLTTSYEWFPTVPKGSDDTPLFTFQAQHKF